MRKCNNYCTCYVQLKSPNYINLYEFCENNNNNNNLWGVSLIDIELTSQEKYQDIFC